MGPSRCWKKAGKSDPEDSSDSMCRQNSIMCGPTLYCTSGGFFGNNSSRISSVSSGFAFKIWDLMARCTEAFTCVDVETSLSGSNLRNIDDSQEKARVSEISNPKSRASRPSIGGGMYMDDFIVALNMKYCVLVLY